MKDLLIKFVIVIIVATIVCGGLVFLDNAIVASAAPELNCYDDCIGDCMRLCPGGECSYEHCAYFCGEIYYPIKIYFPTVLS